MRIDYVLVARQLAPRIGRAEVLGRGAERTGFIGSDHCPLLVEIREPSAQATSAEITTSTEAVPCPSAESAVSADAGAICGGPAEGGEGGGSVLG